MKNNIKCYQCGKEYDIETKNVKEIISCGHCHKQMRIDDRSKKKFRLVRYLFVLLICYADKWCLILTDMIFGLTYEKYEPVKMTKKEIRKSRTQKKGLFK